MTFRASATHFQHRVPSSSCHPDIPSCLDGKSTTPARSRKSMWEEMRGGKPDNNNNHHQMLMIAVVVFFFTVLPPSPSLFLSPCDVTGDEASHICLCTLHGTPLVSLTFLGNLEINCCAASSNATPSFDFLRNWCPRGHRQPLSIPHEWSGSWESISALCRRIC